MRYSTLLSCFSVLLVLISTQGLSVPSPGTVTRCKTVTLQWSGDAPSPFTVTLTFSNDGSPITFNNVLGDSVDWFVAVAGNQQFHITVVDARSNTYGTSGSIAPGDDSCAESPNPASPAPSSGGSDGDGGGGKPPNTTLPPSTSTPPTSPTSEDSSPGSGQTTTNSKSQSTPGGSQSSASNGIPSPTPNQNPGMGPISTSSSMASSPGGSGGALSSGQSTQLTPSAVPTTSGLTASSARHRVSGGIIAAIVIGVILAVVGIAIGIWYLKRRRAESRNTKSRDSKSRDSGSFHLFEGDLTETRRIQPFETRLQGLGYCSSSSEGRSSFSLYSNYSAEEKQDLIYAYPEDSSTVRSETPMPFDNHSITAEVQQLVDNRASAVRILQHVLQRGERSSKSKGREASLASSRAG